MRRVTDLRRGGKERRAGAVLRRGVEIWAKGFWRRVKRVSAPRRWHSMGGSFTLRYMTDGDYDAGDILTISDEN